jgi:hypothetical protein
MAAITAGMVKELRELTGLGMMECKKALEEADGDMKKAEELLRIKSGAKASKAAGRVAADGAIGTYLEGGVGALVEVNAETDFVAKNPDFAAFAANVAKLVATQNPADVAALSNLALGGETVEAARQKLVQKIGENITVRRFARIEAKGKLLDYVHPGAEGRGHRGLRRRRGIRQGPHAPHRVRETQVHDEGRVSRRRRRRRAQDPRGAPRLKSLRRSLPRRLKAASTSSSRKTRSSASRS